MLCQFEKLLYPGSTAEAMQGGYTVALYKPCETVLDTSGTALTSIKAVGYFLPMASGIRFELHGRWTKNAKYGLQFDVDTYDEVIIPTRERIIAYLSSGQIKGIGPKTAEKVYEAFGADTLNVLDESPEKLLCISGISKRKLVKIIDSYLANRSARDVVAFLSPYGVTANRAVRFFKEYGSKTMETVKEHPYKLCEISGIGFKTADRIALSMGLDALSPERLDEGLVFTLTDAESRGHMCMEQSEFIKAALKTLETPGLTQKDVETRIAALTAGGRLTMYCGNVFRTAAAKQEEALAMLIYRKLTCGKNFKFVGSDAELDKEELALRVKLTAEQRSAVKTALSNGLSIITGGPGTGKTMIQRIILDIYSRNNPNETICCCAPTGRAARRMEQAAGYPASTVHKALGLYADDDGRYNAPNRLHAGLVIVDEVSMLDTYLARRLFEAVKPDCRLILIGDADQLPSVGPGAVLNELIESGAIPTVRLDRVFRQNTGSRIAVNARLIRHGNLNLEYGSDFEFVDSPDTAESADKTTEIYLREISVYGIDNVALLTPFRQKTETGANALNIKLHEAINPASPSKPEIKFGKRCFRAGDKVMQVRNHGDVNNGDIGYVREIITTGADKTLRVDFGDGRIKEYEQSELEMLDLGYAATVHKSQGSEYRSVIINLQCAHYTMLTRPLIYTAITRGRERVVIVGEKRALCIAIKKTETQKRGACLKKRLCALIKKEGI